MDSLTLQALLERAGSLYADRTALAFPDGLSYTFKEFLRTAGFVSDMLSKSGIKAGDKVAVLGDNSPHWCIAFFGINRCGAVAVPILPDFPAADVDHILTISGACAIFTSASMISKIPDSVINNGKCSVFSLADFSRVNAKSQIKKEYKKPDVPASADHKSEMKEDDLASLIFTSGTTGHSKGVMLSGKNLVWNSIVSSEVTSIQPGDCFVSVLPLSHTYEFTIGLLIPMYTGAAVYYLAGIPAPSILLPVLKAVRPQFMLSVPLLIEKIYRSAIKPKLTKSPVSKALYNISFFRKILNRVAGKKLMETFGGRIRFFGIGGAPLDPEVEQFLIEAKFPYAVGYGLTETSPLIAGCDAFETKLRAIGPVVRDLEVKLDYSDTSRADGEILVKGPSVMMGYFNDPEATAKVLSDDGWFRTGDLGEYDKDGYLFIKGRAKTMILGPSGENIYPETIEAIINSADFVEESLVVAREGHKLVALVQLNYERLKAQLHSAADGVSNLQEKAKEILANLHTEVNKKLSGFSRLSTVVEQIEPFVKTPTKKIKRYLYEKIQSLG